MDPVKLWGVWSIYIDGIFTSTLTKEIQLTHNVQSYTDTAHNTQAIHIILGIHWYIAREIIMITLWNRRSCCYIFCMLVFEAKVEFGMNELDLWNHP